VTVGADAIFRAHRTRPAKMPNFVISQAMHSIRSYIEDARSRHQKLFAVLVDPDDVDESSLDRIARQALDNGVDLFLVGGSLVTGTKLPDTIARLKTTTNLPVVIFPGSVQQVDPQADALLFLSLISGRNPDLLIGNQVLAAPYVKRSGIEAIATGYMLVDGGAPTTVSYISNTLPIPADKNDIAVCTALAGEMLGMHTIYMDAGSGARQAIPASMIRAVSTQVDLPVIVGGGIRTPDQAYLSAEAGATVIVVGNAIEEDSNLISELSFAVHSASGQGVKR